MTDHIALLKRAIARWNGGDLAGYLDLYSPAITLHGYSPEPMNSGAIRGFYDMIWGSLSQAGKPNPHIELHHCFSSGDMLAARATMSGVHSGPFMGHAATGRPYNLAIITTFRFEGDRVAERWSSADMLGLLMQIGAVPPPPA